MNKDKNELNEKKAAPEEIEETKPDKVAGGVPLLHPLRRYDPDDEPDDGKAGGICGTW